MSIRPSEKQIAFLNEHHLNPKQVFTIGITTLQLSYNCPLSATCIYVSKTGETFDRVDLPCERAVINNAQESRPIGFTLCPVRAAFVPENELLLSVPEEWIQVQPAGFITDTLLKPKSKPGSKKKASIKKK